MQSAQNGYDGLVKKIINLGTNVGQVDQTLKADFLTKIENDFNAPQALAFVFSVLKADISNENKLATIKDFDRVLGLNL